MGLNTPYHLKVQTTQSKLVDLIIYLKVVNEIKDYKYHINNILGLITINIIYKTNYLIKNITIALILKYALQKNVTIAQYKVQGKGNNGVNYFIIKVLYKVSPTKYF